jgi:hypothetical protein
VELLFADEATVAHKCVKAAPAANDADAAAPPTFSLWPLNLLAKQHSLSEEEIEALCADAAAPY